jgi:hypothetical protein
MPTHRRMKNNRKTCKYGGGDKDCRITMDDTNSILNEIVMSKELKPNVTQSKKHIFNKNINIFYKNKKEDYYSTLNRTRLKRIMNSSIRDIDFSDDDVDRIFNLIIRMRNTSCSSPVSESPEPHSGAPIPTPLPVRSFGIPSLDETVVMYRDPMGRKVIKETTLVLNASPKSSKSSTRKIRQPVIKSSTKSSRRIRQPTF